MKSKQRSRSKNESPVLPSLLLFMLCLAGCWHNWQAGGVYHGCIQYLCRNGTGEWHTVILAVGVCIKLETNLQYIHQHKLITQVNQSVSPLPVSVNNQCKSFLARFLKHLFLFCVGLIATATICNL